MSIHDEPLTLYDVFTDDQVRRELAKARRVADKRSLTRRSLKPGSSRAMVTSANARWHTACEAAERWERVALARGIEVPR
jgi:hypothetical protein